MKWANVYQRGDRFYFVPLSKIKNAFRIETGPIWEVSTTEPMECIGRALRKAIEASRMDIAPPRDLMSNDNPLLKLAKVKSFATFAKGACLCSVQCSNGRICIEPTRNGGGKEGFVGLADRSVAIQEDASDQTIGGMITDAFLVSRAASTGNAGDRKH
jgi:hypothetical protein